jgi:hypothetical protein
MKLEDMFTLYQDNISKGAAKFDGATKELTRQHGESSRSIAKEASKISKGSMKIMFDNSSTMVSLITNLVNAAISRVSSMTGSSTSSAPKMTTTSSITSTTNVTNNFSKGGQKGSAVTFDYESQKFWM